MKAIHVSDNSFQNDVINSTTPVLVDFWAEWCGPCKDISPIIEELAKEYDGKLKVVKVDVDANPQLSMDFSIRGIPTLMIFKGGKVVEHHIGKIEKKKLVDKILPHIA
jgi:thioredoxin 1